MSQKILGSGLGLVLILFAVAVFAQGPEDTITITTYYPSPYGVYNELQSNRLAVGDTDGDNKLTSADQPPADGQIYAARGVIFKPHADKATIDALPNPKLGELAYAASEDEWYYYNGGSAWVPQGGGGGGAVISLKCGWHTVAAGPVMGTCTPPSCPSGWIDVGTSCAPSGVGIYLAVTPVVGYCERWCTSTNP